MSEGTVKWFDPKKGYGFIDGDGSVDIFLHHTSFKNNSPGNLNPGDKVSYQIVQGEKGPRAEKIEILEQSKNPPKP